ncbi:helix-turn-helix domain-containing protein [Sinorhizobium fredii]|uniref:XRE family transcriptional regulator n=1 Tax=Rhizobium fredii TaxID=380 RepID=A0A2A6LTP6_RHIFR|nr:helix-turn-helix transcriptional regulator [Sinorhizobium fredii]ASY68792.1 Transcriptional regulator, XRE family [Sinorhizobium fredii CCBAU 83666]PDT45748.1 XRE family transcriptional regulator [Sinorhizobium fredii]
MEKLGIYLGPRLRRLRKDLGLTQAHMAADLDVSPSYIALMERNQRPVTAEVLLRLAKAYKIDLSSLAEESGSDLIARLQAAMKDPIFAEIDVSPLELADVLSSFPGFTEAMLRLYTAYKEEQFALADQRQGSADWGTDASDPVAAVRGFLAARRNCFPGLDVAAEKLSTAIAEAGGLPGYFRQRHNLHVRRLPGEVMTGSVRRLDRHRREILLDDSLDAASQNFQLAQQLAYIEFDGDIRKAVSEGNLLTESARRLAHRAIAAYCAGAIVMPYTAFAKAVEARRYDVEAIARQFGTSFEQTAHRLTTLQKPGQERIPFFFIRVDAAGNVSKRLDSANFPFARHGGGCPLWTLHQVFTTPRTVVTQWLELPDGQRFFSVARTVSSGGGAFGVPRVTRAVALVCEAGYAERMVYYRHHVQPVTPTPIGIACRLCHRTNCTSRSEPPIGRHISPDDYRRTDTPFGFSD